MDVRRDLLVEAACAVAAEQQVVARQRRPSHPELFTAVGETDAVGLAQASDADRGLAVTPPLVAAAEGPVVAVPGGDGALVEISDELLRHGLAPGGGVHGVAQWRELPHRDRV